MTIKINTGGDVRVSDHKRKRSDYSIPVSDDPTDEYGTALTATPFPLGRVGRIANK